MYTIVLYDNHKTIRHNHQTTDKGRGMQGEVKPWALSGLFRAKVARVYSYSQGLPFRKWKYVVYLLMMLDTYWHCLCFVSCEKVDGAQVYIRMLVSVPVYVHTVCPYLLHLWPVRKLFYLWSVRVRCNCKKLLSNVPRCYLHSLVLWLLLWVWCGCCPPPVLPWIFYVFQRSYWAEDFRLCIVEGDLKWWIGCARRLSLTVCQQQKGWAGGVPIVAICIVITVVKIEM